MISSGESSADHLMTIPGMIRAETALADVFVLRQFLSPVECEALIQRIESRRRPSTIADDIGDAAFRTSETCEFDHLDPLIVALDAKLAWVSGITPAHGEPLQGQRYAPGQQFKPHTDYFEPTGSDFQRYCAVSGQRTWTFMIYLNDVAAGGETVFEGLGTTVKPQRGKLLCWNNRHPDGTVNPATLHHATKVRRGVKHVVTRWYRERPWS